MYLRAMNNVGWSRNLLSMQIAMDHLIQFKSLECIGGLVANHIMLMI